MHYIKQCLEPARILNSIESIKEKVDAINDKVQFNAKSVSMIELQLTDKCNLNCPNCHFRNQGDISMQYEWLDLINTEIRPKAISLAGGGEPTLYPFFDTVVEKLKFTENKPQIGLITNGVYIPNGVWQNLMDWIRVSLYTVQDGLYSGKNKSMLNLVLDNIEKYMRMDELGMLGVSILFYHGNSTDCVDLAYEIYEMFTRSGRDIAKFNLQFKRAFILMNPYEIDARMHSENVALNFSDEEIAQATELYERYCEKKPEFKAFLNTCSNIQNMMSIDKRNIAIAQTDLSVDNGCNITRCYTSLEHRLITPDGYVYPCPTVAEMRNRSFAIGHITDSMDEFRKKVEKYYNGDNACCNSKFCRHSEHNKIVESCYNGEIAASYTNEIHGDFFF